MVISTSKGFGELNLDKRRLIMGQIGRKQDPSRQLFSGPNYPFCL